MNDLHPIPIRKDADFGELLSRLIDFFKTHFKPMMRLYVKFGLPYLVLALIGSVIINFMVSTDGGLETLFEMPSAVQGALAAFGGLGGLAFSLFFVLGFLTMMSAIFGYIRGYEEHGSEGAEIAASKFFWPNLGRLMIYGFIILLIIILCVVLFGALASIHISFLLLAIPSSFVLFFYSIKFSLTPYIITLSQKSIVDAFGESYQLTNDRFWWTCGLVVVVALIGSVIQMLIGVPLQLLALLPTLVGGDIENIGDAGNLMLYANFFTYAIYLIFLMIQFSLTPFMYYALYDRKHGVTIEEQIEDISTHRESFFENEGEA